MRPHPAPPVSKRLEDVGVEEDTIEVTEVMIEVISVVDMSDEDCRMVLGFRLNWVSVRMVLKAIDVD